VHVHVGCDNQLIALLVINTLSWIHVQLWYRWLYFNPSIFM